MATALANVIGAILDHYANVIEGTATLYGIPGRRSNDREIVSGTDSPLSVAAGVSPTVFSVAGTYSWESTRWVKDNIPGYWALCTTSGGAGAPNLDAARKITGWDNTTKRFTVTPAFGAAPTAADVMVMLHGFKRVPNAIDIDADNNEGVAGGFDRFFSLSALPGKQLGWYGKGVATYETTLQLRLRMSKAFRQHDSIASVLENLAIIRPILCRSANPDHRDATYTVALLSEDGAAEVVKDDRLKTVAVDKFRLLYKVSSEFR